MRDEDDSERTALWFSIVVAAVLCAGALVWGAISGSRVIVFDGVFMLLGVTMSVLSLVAAKAADSAPDARFPFGRRAVTPLAVGAQGAALLGTLVYAGLDAILVILDGGSTIDPASVLAYGVVTAVVSLAATWWLRRAARASQSDLVLTEAATWKAGTVLSVVFALGAFVAMQLTGRFPEVVVYTDPVLILVACVGLAPVPVGLLRQAGRELLEGAPSAELGAAISSAVSATAKQFGLGRVSVRSTKLGDRLYVDVDFLVEPGRWDVDGEDQVRSQLSRDLRALGYDVWANIELTTDPELLV